MITYEIVLVCPFCDVESPLGTVQATSPYEALQEAVRRWPDARYEEMVARIQRQGQGQEQPITLVS